MEEKGVDFIFSGIKKQPKRLWLFLEVLIFLAFSFSIPFFHGNTPKIEELSFGFAHVFPSSFTAKELGEAFFYQFFPVLMMYISGFSLFSFESALLFIGGRALFSGYILSLFFKLKDEIPLFPLFYFFFCSFELLSLILYLSVGCASMFFSELYLQKRKKSVLLHYTKDVLFLLGLLFFFYMARGGTVLFIQK